MTKIWRGHNYQLTAVSFLLSNPCSGLFLDPGLGKTATSLQTIKILKNARRIGGVLMIAPLRVTQSVWPNEIKKWANFNSLSCTILHGNNKPTLWGKSDIYLINPEGLPWLYQELLTGLQNKKKCPFNVLWVDESTKFKTFDSKRLELLIDMLPLFKRRHIMTGTPAPRSLMDLWSQIYLLDEGKALGKNFYRFRNKYFAREEYNEYSWNIKENATKQIQKAIAPLVLEMKAEDYLDMPELIFNDILVELPKNIMKEYKRMERELFAEIDSNEFDAETSALSSMKCHQLANGAIYEDIPEELDDVERRQFMKTRKVIKAHTAKVEALRDLIDELNGKPVLIAYRFKHDLKAIRKLLGDNVPHIGSGTTEKELQRLEKDWNAGKLPYLVGHPASMGHGLNLQEAGNDVCWFSLTWNLEEYEQFYRRVYRQGVTGSTVRVHHIVAAKTVDEAMLLRLGERAEQQHSLRKALKFYRKANLD